MQHRTTVMLVTRDPARFRKAAATLVAAEYDVVSGPAGAVPEPDLIVRHWTESDGQQSHDPARVLTLDLDLLGGDALLHVVERSLGYPRARWIGAAARQVRSSSRRPG